MREFICLNCGKKDIDTSRGRNKKFCCKECCDSYNYLRRTGGDKGFQACKYNAGVSCIAPNCTKCGWNPVVAQKRKRHLRVKEYEVYREPGYLDLVTVIKANTYEEAQEVARRMGYSNGFRIVEVDNG